MSLALMSLVLLGGLILLLALGVEIAPAMGIVAGLGLIFFVGQPLDYFARAAFEIMNNFTFTAIPLFVFMGAIFSNTGIIGRLFRGAEKIFGNLPGSMASSVIIANAIFGAISGSSLAAVATFGFQCHHCQRHLRRHFRIEPCGSGNLRKDLLSGNEKGGL